MITAKEARQKVEELRNSHEEKMKQARAYINERIEKAIELKDTSVLLSSYKSFYPDEIWQELKDLGYKLEVNDGNIYVRW